MPSSQLPAADVTSVSHSLPPITQECHQVNVARGRILPAPISPLNFTGFHADN